VSENDDFISFEKALRDLKLKSEELRKLVSEGEIRAFRDGPDSMKFRREDVESLAKNKGSDDLGLADSLEDDTGMVTEQLSNEDTLIEDVEAEESPKAKRAQRPAGSRAPAMAAAGAAAEKEPAWVTAVGIVGFLVLVWGFVVTYSISQESDPAGNGFTSVFAEKK